MARTREDEERIAAMGKAYTSTIKAFIYGADTLETLRYQYVNSGMSLPEYEERVALVLRREDIYD